MKFKKFLKILSIFFFVVLTTLYFLFSYYTKPKSDKYILEKFEKVVFQPKIEHLKFKDFKYRKVSIKVKDSLPTMVFVHGTIGSYIDFIEYMKDSSLLTKTNFISYDRVGYNYKDKNEVQESIAFERDMLQNITKNLNKNNTIVVGYSYGGPIALADNTKYKKVILLAPAVYSKVEPMPWLINLYKWKLTRWLVPDIWKQASKEKLSHRKDLQKFEKHWTNNPNEIISIHGNDDAIVPYENSMYLKEQFSKDRFTLVTLPNTGHGLVWSNFEKIKKEFLKNLD